LISVCTKKITTDLITPVTVPASTGFTTYNTNLGEMQNKGVEIGLTLVSFFKPKTLNGHCLQHSLKT
jgi:hypothetical protein